MLVEVAALRSCGVIAGEVLEEGVEAGGDGAVVAALRAFELEDLAEAVFGGRECGHA